ncbi:MAG: DNA cytosine methyltransferase [Oscillospiraceae bacterium]|nr:DNA cytosine methyltransferase [Oscillospiraceae bacterium]
MKTQIDLFDEIIVDNFAGGGGASTGIELAAGRPVTIAINHDPAAILLHKTNHPYTEHLQTSVWDVDPVEVCKGRPVGLAWFSPDCKHFSKAKGSALVDRNIRGLAWIVLRWAGTVRPRVIMLENVEEFQTWGPVRKGKPVKSKAGQTFLKWKQQLIDLGYVVEHRELVAADYGAPTTRKRFVLVARCDGKPIVWPERTHAPRDSEEVKNGKILPWRSAAEIIDWNLARYSIFKSKEEIKAEYGVNAIRPLADNTLRRIIRGVDKFTIKSGKPFLVECNHRGDGHTRDLAEPLNTLTGKYTGGVCTPVMAPLTVTNTSNSVGAPASEPVHTITTAGNQMLVSANLMSIGQTGGGDRIRDAREPIPTVVSKSEGCICAANLIQYHTEQTEKVRGTDMGQPVMTLDGANRYGLVSANLVEYYGNGKAHDLAEPLRTVTTHDRDALVAVHIDKYFNGEYKGCGDPADAPLSTVTVQPRHAVCAAHLAKFRRTEVGTAADEPVPTLTATPHFAVCTAVLAKADGRDLGYWPQIRALLNKHCDYELKDDEVILLIIGGIAYFISDIELRMLVPREQYAAMAFPPDYAIERDYLGNAYPKNQQTAKCGNAVSPVISYAMVRANLPEWCGETITTMAALKSAVAV